MATAPTGRTPGRRPGAKARTRRPAPAPQRARGSAPRAVPAPWPDAAARRLVTLTVNGHPHALEVGRDLDPATTLAYLLRERLGLAGLKISCDEGACGACTVLLDGKAVLSCMVLAVEADGHEILTIEGLPPDDPVIAAFAAQSEPGHGTALQCGYCTPGFVMAAVALLRENPRPTLAEVKEALSGNLCRCGCYAGIAQAVLHAAATIAARGGQL